MNLIVREETPRQDDIAALLRQSDQLADRLYPGEFRRSLNLETLDAPHIRLFVARIDGTATGCCALFDDAEQATAELKRMIVSESFRQRGVGTALLAAAESTALARDIQAIQMEVGVRNVDGQALYRRAGYTERGPFGAYISSPISLFFEKKLVPSTS